MHNFLNILQATLTEIGEVFEDSEDGFPQVNVSVLAVHFVPIIEHVQ